MGEVVGMILVTCFPVMPRFMQVLREKRSKYYSKGSDYPLKKGGGAGGAVYTRASDRSAGTREKHSHDPWSGDTDTLTNNRHPLGSYPPSALPKDSLSSISHDDDHVDTRIQRTIDVEQSSQVCRTKMKI